MAVGKVSEQEILNRAAALELTRAVPIDTALVVVRDDVVSRWCAGCPEYGLNLMCPPALPPPERFRETLANYRRGILVQLSAPLTGEPSAKGYSEAFQYAARLHRAVVSLENHSRAGGFPSARGFIGGCCHLCDTCPGPGSDCRHPDQARSSMEANGISVVETCAAVNWTLTFPVQDSVTWTGLLLLE